METVLAEKSFAGLQAAEHMLYLAYLLMLTSSACSRWWLNIEAGWQDMHDH